jgi:hypothetical protein
MCAKGTECPYMGKHDFEPRYDISINPEIAESIMRLYIKLVNSCETYSNKEIEELRNLFVNKIYVRDICTFCGEIRERVP